MISIIFSGVDDAKRCRCGFRNGELLLNHELPPALGADGLGRHTPPDGVGNAGKNEKGVEGQLHRQEAGFDPFGGACVVAVGAVDLGWHNHPLFFRSYFDTSARTEIKI